MNRQIRIGQQLNHFCLNVLRRTTLPDFIYQLRRVFSYLYAVSADNRDIGNLHNPDTAYNVTHAHVTAFQFPNIAAGFDQSISDKLALRAQRART